MNNEGWTTGKNYEYWFTMKIFLVLAEEESFNNNNSREGGWSVPLLAVSEIGLRNIK
jgi:hypothetical protein